MSGSEREGEKKRKMGEEKRRVEWHAAAAELSVRRNCKRNGNSLVLCKGKKISYNYICIYVQ